MRSQDYTTGYSVPAVVVIPLVSLLEAPVQCCGINVQMSSSGRDGWLGQTLDFPSRESSRCPVRDQNSGI